MPTHNQALAPTDRMLRQFAGLSTVAFGAIATLQEFGYDRHVLAAVLATLAVTVGPLGLARPRAIKPIFVAWMALVSPIGWIVSRVILGTVFYGLFTPFALTFRLMGRDALGLKRPPQADTYWRRNPNAADSAQYLRQF
jgi:hypothetical protein